MDKQKLWGGRFRESTSTALETLNSSIDVDKRLYEEDIEGSIAYSEALRKLSLLTDEETREIHRGLNLVKNEWKNGNFKIEAGDEDIHTANERRLKQLIGEPATKLHTGRSRNDQVITDVKLWLRKNVKVLGDLVKNLIVVIRERALKEIDVIMPGYTHLQRAQPVRWSHFILSHAWNLKKDSEKLENVLEDINIMPLGSGAIAGNPFGIDRRSLAKHLGFAGVTENSMQTVSDRDFIVEFLFWASMVGNHLSRLAEDLIIYSTKEFGFIKIADSFSTGSSLMPQKRNPDSLELIRGVGGSLFGECSSFMMVLKGLPSTYNKDLQGDKESMFSTFDKLKMVLEVAIGTLETLTVNKENCRAALSYDMLATDVAYYLVRKGIPFRTAHHIAGQVVSMADNRGVEMSELELDELKTISNEFGEDFVKVWNYENSIEQYDTIGGTAKSSVQEQIISLETWLNTFRSSKE